MKASRARGFRRLTLAVSLLLLCAGLVITAKDAYQTGRHLVTLQQMSLCIGTASSWNPSNEDLERQFKTPPGTKIDLSSIFDWTEEVRGQKVQECRDEAEGIRLSPRVDAVFTGLVNLWTMNPSLGWLGVRWIARGFAGNAT
jgi:hypothetical protein